MTAVLKRNRTIGMRYDLDTVKAIPLSSMAGQQPTAIFAPDQYPANANKPWGLTSYYFEQVARMVGPDGPRQPPLGDDHRKYLRSAKQLLALCRGYAEDHLVDGKSENDQMVELACCCVAWATSCCIAAGAPSLQWIAKKFDEFVAEVLE